MSGDVIAMGQRLQELRLKAGLSQSQLARTAGVPVGSLKNWEQGRRLPQLDAAWRLANALGISLDELAGKVFEPAPTEPSKPSKPGKATKQQAEQEEEPKKTTRKTRKKES